jgi:hypothetical protein
VQWEDERRLLEAQLARLEQPNAALAVTGQKILELAKQAGFLYRTQDPSEQRRLLETVLSNCTFDRGSLCPTYAKPFDLFVKGNETGNWRRGWDSIPAASCGFCKLQIPHCRRYRECRQRRRALPAIARDAET